MEWSLLYSIAQEPDDDNIKAFIGKAVPLWEDLQSYLEDAYRVPSKMTFSKCSAQPGWNVKYQKGGKSLCTLYPMEGFFIALVVIGAKEEAEAEAAMTLGLLTPYLQELYRKTAFSCGGRWLMIQVTDRAVLEDVKRLIAIRVKLKGNAE
ncbi:MAG TPA: DUF3788 domain-containing protein [Anaerovoracaceae bacterium]|nr:DUF3788 domain-containing protein [Anaerovoracaceae bacterium]